MTPSMKLIAIGIGAQVFCLAMLMGIGCEIGWTTSVPRWLLECHGAALIVTVTGFLGYRFEKLK